MKLADRHGRPLSEVLDYPAWELPFWAVWMAREPDEGRRVESIFARFFSAYLSAHSKKGKSVPKPAELVWPDYWQETNSKQSEETKALLKLFADSGLTLVYK